MMPNVEAKERGEVIRAARETRGWTPDDLADRARLSRQGLIKIEQGRTKEPRRSTLEGIADALGMSVERLYVSENAIADPPARYEFNRDPALDAFTASVTDLVPNATLDAVVGVVREVAKIPPEYHREVLEGAAAYVSVTARRLRARGIRLLGEPD
jgi:transcriptional regulator with XRE-family HTH domain